MKFELDDRGEKLRDLTYLRMYLGGKCAENYSDRSRGTSSGIVILHMRETADIRKG